MAAAPKRGVLGTEGLYRGYDPTPDPRADEPLPLEAIRDLLGLARALYVVRLEQGATSAELAKIAKPASTCRARSRR